MISLIRRLGEKGQTSTCTPISAATAPKDASIDARLEELEAADLGALEADRVRRDDSITRPLDAVVQDLCLDR